MGNGNVMDLTPMLLTGVICTLAMILVFLLREKLSKLKKPVEQLVIGIVFGLVTIYATEFGSFKSVEGAMVNIRNIGPLTAGIIFGGPAGIIAGLIGGIERWFCVYWGGGMYTRLACSFACIIAGIFAYVLKKYLFDKTKPFIIYGFGVGLVSETIHMLLVFVTNMNDTTKAYSVVKSVSLPMMLGAAITMAFVCLVYNILIKNIRLFNNNKEKTLSRSFQISLLVVIICAYFIATAFIKMVQKNAVDRDAADTLNISITDLAENIRDTDTDINDIVNISDKWHIGITGGVVICDRNLHILSAEYEGKDLSNIFDDRKIYKPNECFQSVVKTNNGDVPSYCMYTREGAYYIIGFYPEEEANFHDEMTLLLTILIEIATFAGVFILVYFLIKTLIVDNIDKINDCLADITSGNLDRKVEVTTHKEFSTLSDDINKTVSALKKYIQEAKERIDKELQFAKDIQHSSLPSVFPAYPNDHRFDIYASMYTAKEVGGDFYDFYFVRSNKLFFLIADVSGKGIPAALFMMQTKSYIKALAENGQDLEEIADKVNEKLIESNEAGMFVTAFLVKIDLTSGLCEYVNAGHNAPIIRRANGKAEYLKTKPDFVFTGMEGLKYHKNTFNLYPGDDLFMYTDGVTEANNESQELFGDNRLLEVLDNRKENTMHELLDNVKKQLDFFVGNADQFDDITMLGIRYITNEK